MENYLKQITPEMTKTVNDLKARNFADATIEEIELYAQWKLINALQSEEFAQHVKLREEESKRRKDSFDAQANAALDALNTLKDIALAKLKAVSDE